MPSTRPTMMLRIFLVGVFALIAFVCSQVIKLQSFTALVFHPPKTYTGAGVFMAKLLKKNDASSTLLATWENYSPDLKTYFPVYHSTDLGYSWSEVGRVEDTENNWGMRWHPYLYELPADIGGYKKGDILAIGVSLPSDLKQSSIDIYASQDVGRTWVFVTNVANGGGEDNFVFEPFLLYDAGMLICYFSDKRDPKHTQKIVYQTTTDLQTWSNPHNLVASQYPEDLAGSANVIKLGSTGMYMLSYHLCCSIDPWWRVLYRLSKNPTKFDDQIVYKIGTPDGRIAKASPVALYVPFANEGMILLSSADDGDLFINTQLGISNAWQSFPTNSDASYGRSLAYGPDLSGVYLLGGGFLNGTLNDIQLAYEVLSN